MTLFWRQQFAIGVLRDRLRPLGFNTNIPGAQQLYPILHAAGRAISRSAALYDAGLKGGSPKQSSKAGSNESETRFIGGVRVGAKSRVYLKHFFRGYPEYQYDPDKPYIKEFYRMIEQFDWKPPEHEQDIEKARKGLRLAMLREFNDIYGMDGKDMNVWRNLFGVLGYTDVPGSAKSCRKLIRTLFINICDLVDKPVTKRNIILFVSEERLSKYTSRHKKRFPLSVDGEVKSDLVNPLLRFIDDPEKEDPSLAGHPDGISPVEVPQEQAQAEVKS